MSTTTCTIADTFRARTARSAALFAESRELFPSGITHDGRYLQPYPLFVDRAAGSHKWDVDGNEYVDYAGGHGALLLGHNHPQVRAAVERQLALGTHFGSCHPLEIRWAQCVQRLIPSAERVRFTNSGTEATLLALRLARAFTGKKKLVRFLGHFHGWHDHMAFGVGSHFDGKPTPGVLPEIAEEVLLAPPNDVEAAQELIARDDVAAVIIEPTGSSWGQFPIRPDFLLALRDLTAESGVPLIFDEVISGFRASPGGAQAVYGITPDMTTLAKILAGGLPGGAVVGRREILDGLDFGACSAAGRDKVPHQGTFNANPLSAAAGIATLEIVAETSACEDAKQYAQRLRERLRKVVRDAGLGWVVYGTFSGFHLFTNPQRLPITAEELEAGRCDWRAIKSVDKSVNMALRQGMANCGVDVFSWPGGPTSAVHTDGDLEQTADALRHTLQRLREEGLAGA